MIAPKSSKNIFLLIMLSLSCSLALSSEKKFSIKNVPAEYLTEEGDVVSILQYSAKAPPAIDFSDNFDGYNCTINNKKCDPGMSYPLALKNSTTQSKFKIVFTKGKIQKQTLVKLLPDDFSSYRTSGKAELKSDIVFSRVFLDSNSMMLPNSELFIIKPDGKLAFYRKTPFSAVDFKPHLLDGKVFYSYLRSEISFAGISMIGKREILDENLQPLKIFPELLDMHEFLLFSLNWFMATKYTLAQTSLGTFYINQELIEVKDGQEIYKWSIQDLFDQKYFSIGPVHTQFYGKKSVHQFHLNSIQILSADEILLSLGYDSVIVIDKKTKKIKMALAGANDQFSLTPEQNITFFHTPFYDSKTQTLTVFDNSTAGKPFRVVEYNLDRNNKKINNFSIISTSKMISQSMGSVEKNGKIYSISTGYTTKIMPNFIEQTDKKINMQLTFTKANAFIYRAYRSPDVH